jgi:hypothetical protein
MRASKKKNSKINEKLGVIFYKKTEIFFGFLEACHAFVMIFYCG